jgi:hypothetical protein
MISKFDYLAWHLWLTPVILAIWEVEVRRTREQGQPRENISQDPIVKITRRKWTGYVTQAVEHLLCKPEAEFKPLSHQPKKKTSFENSKSDAKQ